MRRGIFCEGFWDREVIGVKSNAGSPLDRRCEIRRYDGDVAEEVGPLVGLRVCDSVLRIQSGWAVRESAIVFPLTAALLLMDWECHAP